MGRKHFGHRENKYKSFKMGKSLAFSRNRNEMSRVNETEVGIRCFLEVSCRALQKPW